VTFHSICKAEIFLYLIVICLLSPAGAVYSQEIEGTITDAETGLPLENVNILIKGTLFGTTSQNDGRFLIERVAPGEYTLEISMMGYKAVTVSVDVIADSVVRKNIDLYPTVLQLQPIDVTARRYRDVIISPELESPALYTAISIVKKDQIQKQGAKTLTESMQYVPGGFVESRGRKVKQFFSVRGQTYPYPEYAVNGAWQREFHELPYFYSSADIETIEIVRSSAALLTGLSGLAGVIKIDTRRYEAMETSYSAEYGTFNSYWVRLSHGSTIGDVSYASGIGIQGTVGPEGKNAEERMVNLYGRMNWQASENLDLDFNFYHINGKRELALAEPPATTSLQTQIARYDPYRATLLNLKAFYQSGPGASSELQLTYANRDPRYISETDSEPIAVSERDHEFGLNFMQAITLHKNNTLRFGGLYNHWAAPNGKRFYSGRKADLETISAVIVDEYRFGRLNLDGGIRWAKTYINEFGAFNINGVPGGFATVDPVVDQWEPGVFTGSLGGVYYFESPFSIHLNVSAGGIKPREGSLTETFEKPKNENRYKVDLGFQAMIKNIGQVTVTGFFVKQDNAIVLSDTFHFDDGRIVEYYKNRNQDQVGIEIDARSSLWFNYLECFINMLAVYSRYEEGGEFINDATFPQFITSVGLYYGYDGFDINLFGKIVSGYENTRFAARVNGRPPQPQPLGDYFLMNATIAKTFGETFKTRVYLEIQNLSDERYSTVVGYPDFGRRFTVGFSQVFH
jgi:outer membrane cobalamin receptor